VPVIDASVYVALIRADEEHATSWAWFQGAQAAREPIAAPVILLAEVAAALSRGTGDPVLAQRAVQQLVHSGLIELVPATPAMAERAAAIAGDHRIRGRDAICVALAQRLGDCLVTLDRQQLERSAAIVSAREP
jgi:predicted nucleic acid-binding protein